MIWMNRRMDEKRTVVVPDELTAVMEADSEAKNFLIDFFRN